MIQRLQNLAAQADAPQIFRYLVTGVVTFCLEYGALLLLVEYAQLHYWYANGIAFIIANLFNYGISRYWVFARGKFQAHVEIIAYFVAATVGLLINQTVMLGLVEYAAMDYRIAKFFAIGAIVVWNYWSRKVLVFKK